MAWRFSAAYGSEVVDMAWLMLLPWRGVEAVAMAWLGDCRHGMARRLSALHSMEVVGIA